MLVSVYIYIYVCIHTQVSALKHIVLKPVARSSFDLFGFWASCQCVAGGLGVGFALGGLFAGQRADAGAEGVLRPPGGAEPGEAKQTRLGRSRVVVFLLVCFWWLLVVSHGFVLFVCVFVGCFLFLCSFEATNKKVPSKKTKPRGGKKEPTIGGFVMSTYDLYKVVGVAA